MKYPYIGKGYISGAVMLFTGVGEAIAVDRGESNYKEKATKLCEDLFKNITREYLSNTWGVVESKEHAEFIIELAELHGFEVGGYSERADTYFYFSGDYLGFVYSTELASSCNEKQITIPLPPKAVKNEWPQVGDEVTWGEGVVSGEIKAISDGLAWIKNEYGNYCSEYIASLQKPKTPEEELRDELISEINSAPNSDYAVDVILEKYNITKKDKGDE